MNSLEDMEESNKVELPYEAEKPYYYIEPFVRGGPETVVAE